MSLRNERVRKELMREISEILHREIRGLEGVVSIVAPEGTFDTENQTFTVSCCVTVILKMVMEVELLVPSYGYANIPPCQEYTQEVCSGFFEVPLFPNSY